MLTLKKFVDFALEKDSAIRGGVDVTCKDTHGEVLGSISYDCDSGTSRIQACKDAGHDKTAMTAGGPCLM